MRTMVVVLLAIFTTILFTRPDDSVYTEAYMITNLIAAECMNCPEDDIEYITYTLLNRKEHEGFESNIRDVIFEPRQFSSLNRKVVVGNLFKPKVFEKVVDIIKNKEIPKVLFFIARSCDSENCSKMKKNRKVVYLSKNHIYFE